MIEKSGKFDDLLTRIVSAVVMIVVAGYAFYHGGYWVSTLVGVIALLMLWELLRILFMNSGSLVRMATFVAFGTVYILASCLAILIVFSTPETGGFRVFWIVLVVALSDIGGYFAGRIFGGPKIWPAVSPKKTWSGTIGGWVLAIAAGILLAIYGPFGVIYSVLVSLALAMAAQAGDFLESWFKRIHNVKDASNLIPGHGGFLDRLDGLLAATLVFALIQGLG